MDSGMLEAEYESFDALQPRLPEEVVGIMDQLLSHEASSYSMSKSYLWMGDLFFGDRWRGIWEVRSRRPCSLVCISTGFFPQAQKRSKRRPLQVLQELKQIRGNDNY